VNLNVSREDNMGVLRKLGVVPLAIAVGVSCSSSTSPSGGQNLTQAEKTALTAALVSSGVLGPFSTYATFIISTVGQTGSLSAGTSAAVSRAINNAVSLSVAGAAATSYEGAVGLAVEYTLSAGGSSSSGWFLGVVGWNGLNTTTNSVDNLVLIGGQDESGTSLPSSATGTVENGDVSAAYWNGATSTTYWGVSGTGTVSSSSFGSSGTDCSVTVQGVTVNCTSYLGSASGNAQFQALSDAEDSYTQSPLTFSGLPTVKVVISISAPGAAAK
jgi:hypothetical protein